jgi:hypothetical protein
VEVSIAIEVAVDVMLGSDEVKTVARVGSTGTGDMILLLTEIEASGILENR